MVRKKIGVFTGFLLLILLLGVVSAETCSIQSSCGSDYTVMKLSGATNAHGELWDQTNYDQYLCCDFIGTHICDGANKILGLSSATNAHAEIPSLDNYGTDVCFKDLECVSASGSCPSGYNIPMLSLYSNTNAHIGSFETYSTKVCCKYPECAFTLASWSRTEVVEGTTVSLNLQGTNCDGETLSFEIWEDDLVGDDSVNINPVNVVFSGNSATGTWTAEWQSDFGSDPEYYFVATIISTGDRIESKDISPLLTITQTGEQIVNCTDISLCMHYTNETTCENDDCEVSVGAEILGVNCNDPEINCKCAWDEEEGVCTFSWSVGVCGDGIINRGETCDGTEFGAITGCSDFDEFTGGTLSCLDCNIDTSQCIGGTEGICGNGVVNIGETCDGNPPGDYDWGLIITGCSNFDAFTGDNLVCDYNCLFDTIGCTGGTADNSPLSIGTCYYTENTDDDCDDGFLTYSWISNWIWDIDNIFGSNPDGADYVEEPVGGGEWHYDPQRQYEKCVDGSNTLTCPAQIQLPFFTVGTLLATIIVLGVIYWAWGLKKKKPQKKKTKKRKK